MSDAQGVSAQANTMPGTASTATFDASQTEPASSGRLIRLLATLGALIFAYAMWIPWAVVTSNIADKSSVPVLVDPNAAFASNLATVGSYTPTPFVVALFSMLGLLLAPLLWRPADSLLGAIASHVFGVWALFATVFVILFGISPLVSGKPVAISGAANNPTLLTLSNLTGQLALGYWVAVGALVLLWIAIIGLLVWEWRRHAFWHLPGGDIDAPRSIIQLPGASVMNFGLLIWAYGFLAAGWASYNCTQAPVLIGSCQGTPASGALAAAIAQATRTLTFHSAMDPMVLLALDPSISLHALGVLMVGGAFLIFVGVWLRAVTRTFCVWATLWLLLAVALVGVAYSGVGAIIAHPTQYGFPAGNWNSEAGVLVTLIGLIFAIIGLVTLSVAALRSRGG